MKEKPISLAPLTFDEAMADLLKVKPEPRKVAAKARAKAKASRKKSQAKPPKRRTAE